MLWHYAIEEVGAGLATVLGNMQVVIVGVLAWALFHERLTRSSLFAIPVAMLGIVLISGVFEDGAYGDNPALGAFYGVLTGLAYSGFLLALRRSSDPRRIAGPLFEATLASMIFVVPIGLVLGNLDFTPPLEATFWLIVLALSSQVIGWLLISISLARLPTALTSVLLDSPAAARGAVRGLAGRRAAFAPPAGRCRCDPGRPDHRLRRSGPGAARRRSRPCPSTSFTLGTVVVGPRS